VLRTLKKSDRSAPAPQVPADPPAEPSLQSHHPTAANGPAAPQLNGGMGGGLTVGEAFANTRNKFGWSLEQVAADLKIRPVFLRAIEEGRHNDLPGVAYAVGFVRSYADYLGLDPEPLVQRFKAEAAAIDQAPNLNFPAAVEEGKVPTGAIILVSLVLIGIAYLVWNYVSTQDDEPAPSLVAESNESGGSGGSASNQPAANDSAAPASAPNASTANNAGSGAAASDSATPPQQASATANGDSQGGSATAGSGSAASGTNSGGTAAESTAPPTIAGAPTGDGVPVPPTSPARAGTNDASGSNAATGAAAPPPETAAEPPAAAEPEGKVVLRATQDSWIEVRNASNAVIFARVLSEGQSYEVPEGESMRLLTGNAGGLEVLVDGEVMPSLGPPGAVRRNVSLAPEDLRGN